MNAGSGNIRLSGANGKIHANVGSGNIKATDLTLAGKGSFNSGSGDVSITLQSALQYDVSINSGSGDAKLNYNGNKMEGTVVMTANKNNGEILAPFKFDKTEELDEGRNARIRKTARLSDKDIEIRVSTGSGKAVIEK
ncbi:MAG: DUF4097 domain-containing protein [Bacteroidia bacterium]|nr:DUF4097 domain-containing protein [Bacteroidia bacterium]